MAFEVKVMPVPPDAPTDAVASSTAPPQRQHVLVVSADGLFARVAKAKLETWGHSVRIEADAEAAAAWCRTGPCSVVIVDFDLPDGAAPRLCRALRALPRPGYLYLLAYGAGGARDTALAALEAGADRFAGKPLNTAELKASLDHAGRMLPSGNTLYHADGADIVSGVLSAAAFERFFRVLFAQCQRTGTTGLLLFVEVKNVAGLLDRQGAAAVQALETELARRLTPVPRASDLVARLDQGRFCLLLSNTGVAGGPGVAARIGEALRDLGIPAPGGAIQPEIGLGMLEFPGQAASPLALLDQGTPLPLEA